MTLVNTPKPRSAHPLLALLIGTMVLAGCHRDLASYVNPMVGTDLHGHTTPAAIVPFGMIQPGPDTRISGWDGCSGYHYSSDTMYGFSQTHLSGTGCDDYCDVMLMPVCLDANTLADGAPSRLCQEDYVGTFSHKNEKAEAGYYAVTMHNGIKVELTASERVAYHRYTFPKKNGSAKGFVIDLTHRDKLINDNLYVYVDNQSATRRIIIAGNRESSSWNPDQKLFFALSSQLPIDNNIAFYDAEGHRVDNNIGYYDGLDSSTSVKAYIALPDDCESVTLQVALSSVDIPGAMDNLRSGYNTAFDDARAAARDTWNEALGRISLRQARHYDKHVFYTALYHCMTAPYLYSDIDGRYRGTDGQIHTAEARPDGTRHNIYTVFSLWDTYRALHPLLTILEPERSQDFIYTMLQHYLHGGELTMWELWGHETHCMIGYHAVPVILDGLRAGLLDGWDTLVDQQGCSRLELLLDGMTATANRTEGHRHYAEEGYLSSEWDNESVSKTLEYAYDDWCIAQYAQRLGAAMGAGNQRLADKCAEVYTEYIARSQSWKNIIDDDGFMHARRNGAFITPFDPTEVNNHYTEANCWQYSTYVPHDVYGWVHAMGGAEAAHAKLDSLFFGSRTLSGREQSDITGLIGQYAHGNEPSHHAAYLFTYLGQHKKSDGLVHLIRERLYANQPDGLCGNEDCGQMSAWYVLSSLGFYPVCPDSGEWVLTRPLFRHAVIKLNNGNSLVIERDSWQPGRFAKDSSIYDSSAVRLPYSARITPTPRFGDWQQRFVDSCTVTLRMPKWADSCRIFYTLDGSTPDSNAKAYTQPFAVYNDATIKAVALHPNSGYSKVVTQTLTRFMQDRTLAYGTRPAPMYSENGEEGLIDNILGSNNFRLGGWQGWTTDMEVTVDLLDERALHEVGLHCLQDMRAWIFYPTAITVEASTDGKEYRSIATIDSNSHREMGQRSEAEQHTPTIEAFTATCACTARYLRFRAKNYGPMPQWHISPGEQAWLFCSEVIAK